MLVKISIEIRIIVGENADFADECRLHRIAWSIDLTPIDWHHHTDLYYSLMRGDRCIDRMRTLSNARGTMSSINRLWAERIKGFITCFADVNTWFKEAFSA